MYRTAIAGIAWVLLGLSLVAGIVYVIADKYGLNRAYRGGAQRRPPETKSRAASSHQTLQYSVSVRGCCS